MDEEQDDLPEGLEPSPQKPPAGEPDLEAELQAKLAAAEAESEGAEPPEQDQQEIDPGLNNLLDQEFAQSEAIDAEQITQHGEARQSAEAEGGAAADAAHVVPETDDFEPPESLAEYLEQHPEVEDEEGGLPDSSKQFLKYDAEGDIPEWRTLFATDRALSGTMKDLLIDHEQSINDIHRSLESSRW